MYLPVCDRGSHTRLIRSVEMHQLENLPLRARGCSGGSGSGMKDPVAFVGWV